MKIKIINSGSDGNCTILEDTNGCILVLDCGVDYSKIIKECKVNDISCVLCTHHHIDHIKSLKDFQKFYIPTFTWEDAERGEQIGTPQWKIIPIPLVHNAKCFGFLVYSKNEHKKIAYITDTTVIPKLGDIDCLIIDTNYDEEIIEKKLAEGKPVNLGYKNHLSNQQVKEWLIERDKKVPIMVAFHISNSAGNDVDKIKEVFEPLVEKLVISAPNTVFEV